MNIRMVISMIIVSANSVYGHGITETQISWSQLLEKHERSIERQDYTHQVMRLIRAQQQAAALNQLPKIVDPCITTISFMHSNEALVDVNQLAHPRIQMLPNPEKPFASEACNAGFAVSSKMRKNVFICLLSMLDYLDQLAPQFGYKAGRISIRVFEGLRDIATQTLLFNNKMEEIRVANPSMSEEEVFAETCKWVSPVRHNVPVHSTGGAVDIVLWDNERQAVVDMGKFGVIWGKNETAPTFSEQLTLRQKQNRLLLLVAATQAGLTNYPWEFWHFSYGDRYASYWREKNPELRTAFYGPIQ